MVRHVVLKLLGRSHVKQGQIEPGIAFLRWVSSAANALQRAELLNAAQGWRKTTIQLVMIPHAKKDEMKIPKHEAMVRQYAAQPPHCIRLYSQR